VVVAIIYGNISALTTSIMEGGHYYLEVTL